REWSRVSGVAGDGADDGLGRKEKPRPGWPGRRRSFHGFEGGPDEVGGTAAGTGGSGSAGGWAGGRASGGSFRSMPRAFARSLWFFIIVFSAPITACSCRSSSCLVWRIRA